MRHRKKFNHLGRKAGHRKATLANMASSLIMHKRISTTTAKAKALRMYVEPLITRSKDDSTHSRRVVFSYLQSKDAVAELFREVSPKIVDRPGGYTRILKTGTRLGDAADMCIIELVDYNENLLSVKDGSSKSKSRRRRGGKKKTDAPVADATETTAVETATEESVETSEAVVEEQVEAPVEEATEDKAEEAPIAEVKEEKAVEDKAEEADNSDKSEEGEKKAE